MNGYTLNNVALVDIDLKEFERARGRLMRAIAWDRKSMQFDPRNRGNLTTHLNNLRTVVVALKRPDLVAEVDRDIKAHRETAPEFVALNARLVEVAAGRATPKDDADWMTLAFLAYQESRFATSARLYAAGLADARGPQHAYNAACASAFAAAGRSQDETPPDAAAAAAFRAEALGCLKAGHARWTAWLDADPAKNKAALIFALNHWKEDADLASLPEAERKALETLWRDVDQLLARARAVK